MTKEVIDQQGAQAFEAFKKERPEYLEVVVGQVYLHSEGGTYRVVDIHRSAAGYEQTKQTSFTVVYEQLYSGIFPEGTIWTRPVEEFISSTNDVKLFTPVE